jgi:hypothetical protein
MTLPACLVFLSLLHVRLLIEGVILSCRALAATANLPDRETHISPTNATAPCTALSDSTLPETRNHLAVMGSELGITADMAHKARLDAVGIFWIVLASTWTVLLLCGMAFLFIRRNMPVLKMRGLAVSLSAVTCLHLYWVSVQLGYVVGPIAPGDHEYWIMGTWLPFGIALFHASNSRFLHVAQAQRRFVEREKYPSAQQPNRSLLGRFRQLANPAKILVVIACGMVFQVSCLVRRSGLR